MPYSTRYGGPGGVGRGPRASVMVAQSHAGMWRRNGYAFLNQIWWSRGIGGVGRGHRALVMVAQSHAGMWRRNCYALLIHVIFSFSAVRRFSV